jgi:multidrug efflux pump subunit AcrA (membrane-fusion protein)
MKNLIHAGVFIFAAIFSVGGLPVVAHAQELKIEKAIIKIVESVDVPIERGGVIYSIRAREGQLVKKGQVVGNIEDSAFKMRVEKARLELEVAKRRSKDKTLIEYAKKTAEVAQAELKRAENANQSVALAISDTEIDRLKLVVSKTQLEIDKAQIDYDVAKLTEKVRGVEIRENESELEKHVIKSPIDGLVVMVEKANGEWANPGDKLMRVVRINRLRIEGQIRVDLAINNLENKEAVVQVELPNQKTVTKKGKVVFVSPEANPVSRKVAIWVEFDNSDSGLRPGLQGTIIISGDTDTRDTANNTSDESKSPD